MSISAQPDANVRHIFQKHVPEVAAGVVELVSIARDSGKLVMVAVRSVDTRIHPVSVISYHFKNISRELGEKMSVVLWSESSESFILHALAPLGPVRSAPFGPGRVRAPKVKFDAAAHQARVEVDRETFAYFSAQDDTRLRLASRLVGWDIQLVCFEQD